MRSDKPTQAQLKYATDLIRKTGYDRDKHDLENMTRGEVSNLISKLKYKLYDLR